MMFLGKGGKGNQRTHGSSGSLNKKLRETDCCTVPTVAETTQDIGINRFRQKTNGTIADTDGNTAGMTRFRSVRCRITEAGITGMVQVLITRLTVALVIERYCQIHTRARIVYVPAATGEAGIFRSYLHTKNRMGKSIRHLLEGIST